MCPITTDKTIHAQFAMREFINALFNAGRKLNLGEVGSLEATPDERTLLNVLSAAQDDDNDNTIAALRWLLGKEPDEEILAKADKAGHAFSAAGWVWDKPSPTRTKEPPYGVKPVREVR